VKRRIVRVIQSRGRLLLVALCVSVALAAFAVQALGSFGKPRHFAVGTRPASVAIGDLNGDGKRDLAVADTGSNSVSVLLGNGAGGFGAATSFPVGRYPDSVAIGDLNGDGNLDLVVANSGSGTKSVSVLLGNGAGGFGPATNSELGTGPISVAIGDLNDDGIPDLAAARRTNVVSVLLGTGNGAFEAALHFVVGLYPSSVAIGDLNGDGNLDLVVTNSGSYNRQPGTVSILLGNGEGNFRAAKNFAAGYHPYSVAIGDLNRDGKPDLAVSNATAGSGFGHVSILIGKGGGTFAAPRHLRVGSGLSGPRSVAIGKLDAGPYPDLAVALSGSNNVAVLLNRGPSTAPRRPPAE
jgi:hypothetical protein